MNRPSRWASYHVSPVNHNFTAKESILKYRILAVLGIVALGFLGVLLVSNSSKAQSQQALSTSIGFFSMTTDIFCMNAMRYNSGTLMNLVLKDGN